MKSGETVGLTEFSLRHFEFDFSGTVIPISPEEFAKTILSLIPKYINTLTQFSGYADFCKLVALPVSKKWDFKIEAGAYPITPQNECFLKSAYKARNDKELPVLTRWFDFPEVYKKVWARNLLFILYSREQILKEGNDSNFNADWGVVGINAQLDKEPDPMPPITAMRNALGVEEGGSDHPLDRDEYLKSVEFWDTHATVKKVEKE